MSAIFQQTNANLEFLDSRRMVENDQPTIFTDIYQADINMTVWKRELSSTLQHHVARLVESKPGFKASTTLSPKNALACIVEILGSNGWNNELSGDIANLVEMFCYLFDLKRAGLRMTTLDQAMCPRFHVDNVPCRLVTTYQGAATQWLSHDTVDRTKLGRGNQGLTDEHSGIYSNPDHILQLNTGDVALLKGEKWAGNENAGLVHRSPELSKGERRLLLTLDFMA